MIRRHIKFSYNKQRGQISKWKGKMSGVPVFIIGNGPSLNDEDVSLLNPFFTIGINRAFLKIDPTVLMWQDIGLWSTERKNVIRLSAIKVCTAASDPENKFFHFKLEPGNFEIPEHPGILHGTGSTGPLAVQFAHSLGCNPIILMGMDCKPRGQATDFYGKNHHHKPHTMANCQRGLKWVKKHVTDRQVICCSDNDHFERMTLAQAVAKIDPKWKKDRAYYSSLLTR